MMMSTVQWTGFGVRLTLISGSGGFEVQIEVFVIFLLIRYNRSCQLQSI